jgi:hypothetical protein
MPSAGFINQSREFESRPLTGANQDIPNRYTGLEAKNVSVLISEDRSARSTFSRTQPPHTVAHTPAEAPRFTHGSLGFSRFYATSCVNACQSPLASLPPET